VLGVRKKTEYTDQGNAVQPLFQKEFQGWLLYFSSFLSEEK